MKKSEKLDLILKSLYESNSGNKYHSLFKVIRTSGITLQESESLLKFAKKLKADGMIEFLNVEVDIKAKITKEGQLFCQRNSYAYVGYPIITHIQP